MKGIVDANPFRKVAANPANLCVTFLSHAPARSEVAPLHAQDWRPERFEVSGWSVVLFVTSKLLRGRPVAIIVRVGANGSQGPFRAVPVNT